MRACFAMACVLAGVGLAACRASPRPAPCTFSSQAGQHLSGDHCLSAEFTTKWQVSSERAIALARAACEMTPQRGMRYEAQAVLRGAEQLWFVSGTSALAGGWLADVDAKEGEVLRTRRLPGR